jgi:flagellar biosynthetic protein FliR
METLQVGLLVFARLTAFIYLVPFFSIAGIPGLVKAGFGVFLTALILPSLSQAIIVPIDMAVFSLLIVKEVLIGLILGYVGMLTFTAIRMAGELIDIQMGFSMATVLDPQNQTRTTLMGQFLYIFQLLLFLAVDGHHTLLMAISYSYELIPVAGAVLKTSFIPAIIKMFIQVFSLGIRLAAPFIVVFLICDIALGIIARTVPQLNVFILSFPIKSGIGLITLAAILPLLCMMTNNIFSQMEKDLQLIIGILR